MVVGDNARQRQKNNTPYNKTSIPMSDFSQDGDNNFGINDSFNNTNNFKTAHFSYTTALAKITKPHLLRPECIKALSDLLPPDTSERSRFVVLHAAAEEGKTAFARMFMEHQRKVKVYGAIAVYNLKTSPNTDLLHTPKMSAADDIIAQTGPKLSKNKNVISILNEFAQERTKPMRKLLIFDNADPVQNTEFEDLLQDVQHTDILFISRSADWRLYTIETKFIFYKLPEFTPDEKLKWINGVLKTDSGTAIDVITELQPEYNLLALRVLLAQFPDLLRTDAKNPKISVAARQAFFTTIHAHTQSSNFPLSYASAIIYEKLQADTFTLAQRYLLLWYAMRPEGCYDNIDDFLEPSNEYFSGRDNTLVANHPDFHKYAQYYTAPKPEKTWQQALDALVKAHLLEEGTDLIDIENPAEPDTDSALYYTMPAIVRNAVIRYERFVHDKHPLERAFFDTYFNFLSNRNFTSLDFKIKCTEGYFRLVKRLKTTRELDLLFELGKDYTAIGKPKKAKMVFDAYLEDINECRDIDEEKRMVRYYNLSQDGYCNIRAYKNALDLAEQVKDYFYKKEPNSSNLANSYHVLGQIQNDLGKNEVAETNLEKAVEIKEIKTAGEIDLAVSYHDLGRIQNALGKNEIAETNLEKAIEIKADKAAGEINLAVSYHVLGRIQNALGKNKVAETNLEKAVKIKEEKAQGEITLATSYHELGRIQNALGKNEVAETNLEKAIKISEEKEAGEITLASSYHVLGQIQNDLGKNEIAETNLEKAIEIKADKAAGEINLAVSYHVLGRIQNALGKNEVAETNLEKAIEIYIKKGSPHLAIAQDLLAKIRAARQGE
jgi:tetratricopeptide (TPR) repeat protein